MNINISIKDFFDTDTGHWMVTDVGSRTITAIKIDKSDTSWYHGPPYAILEYSFDEDGIEDILRLNPEYLLA